MSNVKSNCVSLTVTKSQEWWHSILLKYMMLDLKKIMRMELESFRNLITKIGTHSIFLINW